MKIDGLLMVEGQPLPNGDFYSLESLNWEGEIPILDSAGNPVGRITSIERADDLIVAAGEIDDRAAKDGGWWPKILVNTYQGQGEVSNGDIIGVSLTGDVDKFIRYYDTETD